MQVILEKAVDNPDSTDRANIFGVHEYNTTYDAENDTYTTTLYWPYHAAADLSEHTARPVAGTNISQLSVDTLIELMLQPEYVANTVLILGEEYDTVERALSHLTESEKESIQIIRQNESVPLTEDNNVAIDFFNTTGET